MANMITKLEAKKTAALLLIFGLTFPIFSQTADNGHTTSHFGGAVTVTNNGISLIPNFTLGKPAAIFDLSLGKGKLSFEPQFRFALEGKPWSFLFWWRYKLLNNGNFQISAGAHPAVAFKTRTIMVEDYSREIMTAQRFLAGELAPNYFITRNISVGMYYLYSHGFEKDAVQNTNFLALRSSFSSLKLTSKYFMKFLPQIYYLNMDGKDGVYVTSALTLARRNFPVSISATINAPLHTEIVTSRSFIWNASLTYAFNKEYVRK